MGNFYSVELHKELKDFYYNEVVVNSDEMKEAKELVMYFVKKLQNGFRRYSELEFEIGEPILCGSVWEKAKTENCKEFDVDFPLLLDSQAWDCIKLPEYGESYGPYNCFLKNGYNDDDDIEILQKFGTDFDSERTIDPLRVKKAFQEEVVRILKFQHDRFSEMMYRIQKKNSASSPAVTLALYNRYDPGYVISVDIVPSLHMVKPNNDNVYLVPKGKSGYWRRSFATLEKDLMNTMDDEDNGCRKMVLRIFKTLASKQRKTPLSHLDSYTLKNAVLNLHNSGDWSRENLATCFIRVLEYLEACFDEGDLPRYFEKKHNLLNAYNEDIQNKIADFIQKIRKNEEYYSLLNN